MEQLSDGQQVRLPLDVLEEVRAESKREGIPVAVLLRRDIIRGRRGRSHFDGDYGNTENSAEKEHVPPTAQRATGENVTAREEVSA